MRTATEAGKALNSFGTGHFPIKITASQLLSHPQENTQGVLTTFHLGRKKVRIDSE